MAGLSVDIPGPLEVELPGTEVVQKRLREVEKHDDDVRKIQMDAIFDQAVNLGSSGERHFTEMAEGAGPVVMRRRKVGVARQTPVESEPQDGDAMESQGLLKVAEAGISVSSDRVHLRLEETSASLAAALEVVEEKIKKDDR